MIRRYASTTKEGSSDVCVTFDFIRLDVPCRHCRNAVGGCDAWILRPEPTRRLLRIKVIRAMSCTVLAAKSNTPGSCMSGTADWVACFPRLLIQPRLPSSHHFREHTVSLRLNSPRICLRVILQRPSDPTAATVNFDQAIHNHSIKLEKIARFDTICGSCT